MNATLRLRAILRHECRNERIALGRPAVCLAAIRPYSDLSANTPSKNSVMGFFGEQWGRMIRAIRRMKKT